MKALLPAHVTSFLALSFLALAWAGCHEQVVLAKDPPPAHESEPNDSADQAPWYGTLVPGSRLALTGHITSDGPDLFDGFAFTTGAPCTLRFTLAPSLPGTDLDLCLYDPWLEDYVACFDGTDEVEVGEIGFAQSGIDFHLVVTSAWASSSYLLQIEAIPFVPSPAEARPSTGVDSKRTLEKVRGYRGPSDVRNERPASIVAAGWIGEIDLSTGHILRAPFALSNHVLALGRFEENRSERLSEHLARSLAR